MVDTSNVSIFGSADEVRITDFLGQGGVTSILVTNGIYDRPQDLVLPSTVAAFQYLTDSGRFPADAAITIALNSDASLRNSLLEKGASDDDLTAQEPQRQRAMKLWPALSAQFPERRVIILFYDQPDPAQLYNTIAAGGMTRIANLHKYAFGVPQGPDQSVKKILGAEAAETVYGFPLPKDTAHMHSPFWNVTPEGGQKDYTVIDLTREHGPHGAPYLTDDNKILFPAVPLLEKFRPNAGAAQGAAPKKPGIS